MPALTQWENMAPDEILKTLYDKEEVIEQTQETNPVPPVATSEEKVETQIVPITPEPQKELTLEEIYDIEDSDQGGGEEEEGQEDDEQDVPKPKATKKDVIAATAVYKAEKYGIDVSEIKSWDEEALAALEDKIDEVRLQEKWEEAKGSNEVISALLDVAENGGDLSDVLSLFREQKELNEINTTTIEGQLEYLEEYYINVEKWSPDKVKRYLSKLDISDDANEVTREFEEAKLNVDDYYKTQREAKLAEAAELRKARETAVIKHKEAVNTTLDAQKFKKAEAREIHDFIFKPAFKINGTEQVLTSFDKELRELRKNPERLVKLALLLKDEKAYEQKLVTDYNSKKNDEKFTILLQKQKSSTRSEEIETSKNSKIKPKLILP